MSGFRTGVNFNLTVNPAADSSPEWVPICSVLISSPEWVPICSMSWVILTKNY